MSHMYSLPRAACVAALLLAAGCGGGSSPTTPTPNPTPTPPAQTTTVNYSGLFASGMFTGTVTMTAAVPTASLASSNGPLAIATASGTAKFSGASTTTVNLTGTFDTTTNKFTLTAPGWTIDATLSNNRVSGTISTPTGAGGVAALVTTAANPVVSFCGSYTGTESGKFMVSTSNGFATGVAAENGLPGGVTLAGTVTGNTISLSWSWTDGVGGQGVATGTINGTSVSGTWSNTDSQSGNWSGGACSS